MPPRRRFLFTVAAALAPFCPPLRAAVKKLATIRIEPSVAFGLTNTRMRYIIPPGPRRTLSLGNTTLELQNCADVTVEIGPDPLIIGVSRIGVSLGTALDPAFQIFALGITRAVTKPSATFSMSVGKKSATRESQLSPFRPRAAVAKFTNSRSYLTSKA